MLKNKEAYHLFAVEQQLIHFHYSLKPFVVVFVKRLLEYDIRAIDLFR